MGGNPIGSVSLQQMLDGLGSNNGLQELNLNRTNPFFHASLNFSCIINKTIQNKGQNLLIIDLSQNLLGDQAAISILPSLCTLEKLKSLSLSGNHLGDKFLATISLSNFRSKHLRLLDISENTFLQAELLERLIYLSPGIRLSGLIIDV